MPFLVKEFIKGGNRTILFRHSYYHSVWRGVTKVARKDDNPLAEMTNQIKRAWRHRSGLKLGEKQVNEIKVFGKTLQLEHTLPGIIHDTFDNLGFETKDGRKPIMVGRKKTEYGEHLVWELPPGISFGKVRRVQDYFSDAVKGYVELTWLHGYLHMDVQINKMPGKVHYDWDPVPYLKKGMILPIPIGYSHKKLEVWDLAAGGCPHLLIGGATRMGKTNEIMVLIHSLLLLPPERIRVCVIDRKEVDFDYLKEHVLLARSEEEALRLLKALWREHLKRKEKLLSAGVKKIQDLKDNALPYIVCVIDEFVQLQNEESHFLIDQFVRLSAAMGIHLIAATQRPSSKKMDTDTRSQFDLRMCFSVASEIDSRMILGETNSEAAWLPRIQGRALFRAGAELTEVQTMYLPDDKALQLLANAEQRGWGSEWQHPTRLLPG